MTVLVDLDNVLWKLTDAWVDALNARYALSHTADEIRSWDICSYFPELTKREVFSVILEDAFWGTLSPVPDAGYYMQRLMRDGHEVFVVSATPHFSARAKIDRMLEIYPFLDIEHIILAFRKDLVQGDVLIDDSIDNLSHRPVDTLRLLFTSPNNTDGDLTGTGIRRVDSWAQAYRAITRYSRQREHRDAPLGADGEELD